MMQSSILYSRGLLSMATRSTRRPSSCRLISNRQLQLQHNMCTSSLNSSPKLIRHRHSSTTTSPASTSSTTPAATQSSSTASGTMGKIFFPSLCAITFTLGIWQTKRYFEKVDMVQKRKDDLSLEPLSFEQWRLNVANSNSDDNVVNGEIGSSGATVTKETTTKSYRRVTISGQYDHPNSILIGPRGPPPGALATSGPNSGMGGGGGMSSSLQGYWVVTPLIIGGEERDDVEVESESGSVGIGSSEEEEEKKGWYGRLMPWRRSKSVVSDKHSEASTQSSSSDDKPTIVWINRGWIPRHYINQNTNQVLQSWDEPKGHVTLLSMESQTEKGGGMFTPPSRIETAKSGGGSNAIADKKTVRKLLWMDREAMEGMTNVNKDDHPPLFVQINTTSSNDEPKSFPVQPSEEYVGEFKVTPDVHMGYAITWFGLSGAGVVMTRKLLMRGR